MAKILILDDSNMARRMLRKILESAGHEVLDESEGLLALERFFLEKPELTFIDLTMEGMGGLEVLQKILAIDPHAKVIIVTADTQKLTRDELTAAGASAFLNKPADAEQVVSVIADLLDRG